MSKRIALVLAGSRAGIDPVAAASGVSAKAFAPIGGQPMIERVLTTLRSATQFDAIRVSLADGLPLTDEAPQLARWIDLGEVIREEPAGSPSQSVLQVLEKIDATDSLVVTTADHPLLTVESLQNFLQQFDASPADAVAAVTAADAIRERYPEMRRTALRFREENLAGCNLFAFTGAAGLPVVRFWNKLEAHRKRPWQLARILGSDFLVRYPLGQLTLEKAIHQLEKKTGASLATIHLPDPHMGIDVDSPEHLEQVRAILEA